MSGYPHGDSSMPDLQTYTSLRNNQATFDETELQTQSRLFSLPAELRDRIWTLVLTPYEDTSRLYNANNCYYRPGYTAPRKSDLALLSTCKKIYLETWYKPWALADYSFWLTWDSRRPGEYMDRMRFDWILQLIHHYQGDTQIRHVRVFAQMWAIEGVAEHDHLPQLLSLDHFQPVHLTITIRHTDWWCWEVDQPLFLKSEMVRVNRFPKSLRKLSLQLETLDRKKDHLDVLVAHMKANWYFTKSDNAILSARSTNVATETWKGRSVLDGQRWLRDEVEIETLKYYVATITFEEEHDLLGSPLPDITDANGPQDRLDSRYPKVDISFLEMIGVEWGTDAATVCAKMQEWDANEAERREQEAAEDRRARRQVRLERRARRARRVAPMAGDSSPDMP